MLRFVSCMVGGDFRVFGCDSLFGLMLIVLVVLLLGDECVSFVVLLLITCWFGCL